MPIPDDLKDAYPDHWNELREARLKLATRFPADTPWLDEPTPCCEWCGRPNGATVPVYEGGVWETQYERDDGCIMCVTVDEDSDIRRLWNLDLDPEPEPKPQGDYTLTETVLTTAHLCHDPRCDDLTHLRALCQRDHLMYDQQTEQRAKRERIYAEIRGQQTLAEPAGCDDCADEIREFDLESRKVPS